MTDREALLACYLSGQMSAAQWERHCEDAPELRALLDRQGLISKEGVAAIENAEEGPIRWVWSDGSCHGEPESSFTPPRAMTDPIAAVLEALEPFATAAGKFDDIPGVYRCADDVPIARHSNWIGYLEVGDLRRARAALASYDAAAPSRQSAGVEAMARELAADFLIRNSTESEMLSALLSFAARVAADQRERDAKIAETPDPQRANKTAAQIAAAIRASAKPF